MNCIDVPVTGITLAVVVAVVGNVFMCKCRAFIAKLEFDVTLVKWIARNVMKFNSSQPNKMLRLRDEMKKIKIK